ncbi:hypothetical protein ACFL04_01580 [Patescibacteria group bacterium]
MANKKTPYLTILILQGLILSLTVFVLSTVILNKISTDRLIHALDEINEFNMTRSADNEINTNTTDTTVSNTNSLTFNTNTAITTTNTNTSTNELADWQTYESINIDYNGTFTTTDWNSYPGGGLPMVNFSLKYPATWSFNGSSVFSDENSVKIAEFSPGPVRLNEGQSCFDNYASTPFVLEEISRSSITIGSLPGVKLVNKVQLDGTPDEIYSYPNEYCLDDGTQAFVMTFYEDTLGTGDIILWEQILSTFQFTN